MEVEVSLRLPNMKVRAKDEHGYPIDHSLVRFKKLIDVPSVPKAGATLELTTATGSPFNCTVVRSDWDESAGRFVLACQNAKRSITPEEYAAIVNDPAWEMKPLI